MARDQLALGKVKGDPIQAGLRQGCWPVDCTDRNWPMKAIVKVVAVSEFL